MGEWWKILGAAALGFAAGAVVSRGPSPDPRGDFDAGYQSAEADLEKWVDFSRLLVAARRPGNAWESLDARTRLSRYGVQP